MIVLPVVSVSCSEPENFRPTIALDKGWKTNTVGSVSGSQVTIEKEFNLSALPDKLYFLYLHSTDDNLRLQVNNYDVPGVFSGNRSAVFNITSQLKPTNKLVLETRCENTELLIASASLHCVNKLFIPDIRMEYGGTRIDTTPVFLNVRVRNAFDSEQQGILRYSVYAGKNRIVKEKEIPVFVSGNSENTYRQRISFDEASRFSDDLQVKCELLANKKQMDVQSVSFSLQ